MVLFCLCSFAHLSRASELGLEIQGCPSLSRAVTSELLGIELRTLGISPAAAMVWVVRCQGQSATVELLAQPKKESVDKPLESIEAQTSMQIDLSRTDEAAWPRLIALAASELAEQGLARATATRSGPAGALAAEGSRARSLHVSVFAFDVKTKRKSHTVALGVGLTRLGDPGAWLLGPTLGAELPIGRRTILGSDLRVQWGQSTLAEGTVSWRLASAAVLGGFALTLRPIEASVHVGIRAGQLALSGEAKSAEQSGQRLVGPTGGPLVGLRLRTASVRGLFAGADLEVGYAWWSVQGNDDAGPPAVTVDGAWTHAAAGVGWELEHPEARSNTPTRKQLTQANNVAFMAQRTWLIPMVSQSPKRTRVSSWARSPPWERTLLSSKSAIATTSVTPTSPPMAISSLSSNIERRTFRKGAVRTPS